MVEPIFSSKLFAVSSRKAEIRAAASNPINQNLMQQLSTALDKSYQKAEYLLDEEDQEKLRQEQAESAEPEVDETEESEVTEETGAEPKEHSAPPAKPSNLHSKFKEAEKSMSEDEPSEPAEGAPTDTGSVDTKMEAATDIDNGIEDNGIQDTKSIADSVKAALNDNAETAGVSRTAVKDDELWVYYEDSINLNKVMASAIETLNTLGYGLEFNRLARSDNAIVFLT
jgi:hypothetical protein